jgi:hypothetical protein
MINTGRKLDEDRTDSEAERIATDALRRALSTPYRPQKKIVGKVGKPSGARPKSKKKTPAKR